MVYLRCPNEWFAGRRFSGWFSPPLRSVKPPVGIPTMPQRTVPLTQVVGWFAGLACLVLACLLGVCCPLGVRLLMLFFVFRCGAVWVGRGCGCVLVLGRCWEGVGKVLVVLLCFVWVGWVLMCCSAVWEGWDGIVGWMGDCWMEEFVLDGFLDG